MVVNIYLVGAGVINFLVRPVAIIKTVVFDENEYFLGEQRWLS